MSYINNLGHLLLMLATTGALIVAIMSPFIAGIIATEIGYRRRMGFWEANTLGAKAAGVVLLFWLLVIPLAMSF